MIKTPVYSNLRSRDRAELIGLSRPRDRLRVDELPSPSHRESGDFERVGIPLPSLYPLYSLCPRIHAVAR